MRIAASRVLAAAAATSSAAAIANPKAEALAYAVAEAGSSANSQSTPAPGQIGNHTATFSAADNALLPAPVPGPYEALNWNATTYFCGQSCTIRDYGQTAQTVNGGVFSASSSYAGSKVAWLDLFSFGAGCYSTISYDGKGGSIYPAPVNCTIKVEGWRGPATGAPTVSTTFEYRPQIGYFAGYETGDLAAFTLPGNFRVLRNIKFTPSLAPDAVKTYSDLDTLLDNVFYRAVNATR